MKVDNDRLFSVLGAASGDCPVCGTRMTVFDRLDRMSVPVLFGSTWFECPGCGFRGDAVHLHARATGLTAHESLAKLRDEEILSCTDMEASVSSGRLDEQAVVDEHFERCVDLLRQAPERCHIRAGLSVASIRQLPPDTGMWTPNDAPQQFALLFGRRYRQTPMVLYRYRYDGETTIVDAQNPTTLEREHRIRISGGSGDVGVYLGDYTPGYVPETIVVTENPRTAGQIYGACRAESSLTPPVVGVAGFPMPSRFSALRRVYLLDADDSPLSLVFALKCFTTRVVYGVSDDMQPQVRVVRPQVPAAEIRAENIRYLVSHVCGDRLQDWIRSRLVSMSDRLEEVANALLQADVPDGARTSLAAMLSGGDAPAPKSLVDVVMLPTTTPDDVLSLGNGRLVRNTPVGIYAAAKNRKTGCVESRTLLSNVGIEVVSRVSGCAGETAVCRITHPDQDVPPVVTRISAKRWSNPDLIASDIRAAYADFGRTPYVSLYRSSGYAWGDIMQLLGSHCAVQDALEFLGQTQDGTVNFPCVCVSKGGFSRQTRAGDVDQDVMSRYSALSAPEDGFDGFSWLGRWIVRRSSPRMAGVAAGVLHVVHAVTGAMFDPSGARRPPSHLLFVETEPGIWDGVFRDLAYILSGSEYVPILDYADPLGTLSGYSGLGTLPLLARIPSLEGFAETLSNSPVPVIGIVDVLTAISCSGRGQVSFVLPNAEHSTSELPDSETVSAIRSSIVSLAAMIQSGCPWRNIQLGGQMRVSAPCLSVAGSLLGDSTADPGSPYDCMLRSVRARFPGIGMTGLTTFFNVLHREYSAVIRKDPVADIKLTFVHGAPPEAVAASFNERGEHVFVMEDVVVISRQVVQVINREKVFLFDAEQLSNELSERGLLLDDVPASLGIDPRRVWAVSRATWDEMVVRSVGFNEKEMP